MNQGAAEEDLRDRRVHSRVQAEVPIPAGVRSWARMGTEEADVCNISCSGLYCTVSTYIPPLTRVEIGLSLPLFEENHNRREQVKFKGTVVRAQSLEAEGGYGLAIFFSGLTERARRLISSYVSQVRKQSA